MENFKKPLPILKPDFVEFMVKNYGDLPIVPIVPLIKEVIVKPKIISYKLRLVSPVAKFQTLKSYLNPFTFAWF